MGGVVLFGVSNICMHTLHEIICYLYGVCINGPLLDCYAPIVTSKCLLLEVMFVEYKKRYF